MPDILKSYGQDENPAFSFYLLRANNNIFERIIWEVVVLQNILLIHWEVVVLHYLSEATTEVVVLHYLSEATTEVVVLQNLYGT